jgi:ESCRT-II complex subunit VPS25
LIFPVRICECKQSQRIPNEANNGMPQEFYGLDRELMVKALQVLVKKGKAQLFGQEDSQGVKFF